MGKLFQAGLSERCVSACETSTGSHHNLYRTWDYFRYEHVRFNMENCVFKKETYQFPDSLVADVFKHRLELGTLESDRNWSNICFWDRYLDKIICIWCGPVAELQSLLDALKFHHALITFTREIGSHKNCIQITMIKPSYFGAVSANPTSNLSTTGKISPCKP